MHIQHCSYWCPGVKAPGNQHLQHWLNIHFIGPASCMNITFIDNNTRKQNHILKKHCPDDGNNQLAMFKKQFSQCILEISKCHWTLGHQHRNPIINRVHAPTKVNSCTKYEHKSLNVLGSRVVTRAGQRDGGKKTDGHMAKGITIPYCLTGPIVNQDPVVLRVNWLLILPDMAWVNTFGDGTNWLWNCRQHFQIKPLVCKLSFLEYNFTKVCF